MSLSLYIHIPWCLHKCSYCDFYSLPSAAEAVPGAAYVDRLISELDTMLGVTPNGAPIFASSRASWLSHSGAPSKAMPTNGVLRRQDPQHCIHSIFLGGGTPSMIPPRELARLLDAIAQRFDMPAEITIEANPETLDEKVLRELRAAGFTRLSCGVQSFDPRQLQFLERVHSAEKAREALRAAQRAGFENRSLDLIYTLPNQTISGLENDLHEAIALEPTHISAYQLIVEPGTPLERMVNSPLPPGEGPPRTGQEGEGAGQVGFPLSPTLPRGGGRITLPDEDTAIAMWHHVREVLGGAGYAPYEISNFARPGFECAHNIHYWDCGDYLGIGAGAVSRIGAHRWRRARNVKAYLATYNQPHSGGEGGTHTALPGGGATRALMIDQEEYLTPEQLRTEVCMLGLRMSRGIDMQEFEARFGRSFEEFYPGKIAAWTEKGLATSDTRLRLTPSGMLILDSLVAELF